MANVKVIVKAIACADGSVTQNGNPLFDVASGATFDLITKLDGVVEDGTWDGVDTLDFTSAVCSPVTFQINAVNKESLSSGSTFNLITKLDGSVNSGSYDAPTDTLSFTSAACSPVALQINGTPQESIAAGATFNLIATLDGVAGGTYTPATDTLSFTSTGGWVRPSFWPTLPTLTAASQAGYILLQVYQNRLNRFTCQIYNNAAIDWGDGTTSAPTTAVRTKTYTYSTLSGTVYVDALTSENYKFVTISITASGGNISLVDFAVSAATSPLNSPSYAVDWNLSFPNATTLHMGALSTRDNSLMQQLRLWSVGSGCYIRIGKSYNLQSLQLPVSMVLSQPTIASNIGACRVGNLDYSTTTNVSSNFNGSRILSHGNLIANSATSIGYYLADSYSCESIGAVTCNAVVGGATWMFSSMTALKSIGLITMPLATDYSYMFVSSPNLNAIRFANSAACTTTTGMISNCLSLQVLHLPNLTRGVNFTNTSIGNYGMNIFASGDGILNGIGTASGAQTITITGTPFGALVTALDPTALAIRAVLIGKGYTIAN